MKTHTKNQKASASQNRGKSFRQWLQDEIADLDMQIAKTASPGATDRLYAKRDKLMAKMQPEAPQSMEREETQYERDTRSLEELCARRDKLASERDQYKASAERLAEALRGMMSAFAWKVEQAVAEDGENVLQSDVRRARTALLEYGSFLKQGVFSDEKMAGYEKARAGE